MRAQRTRSPITAFCSCPRLRSLRREDHGGAEVKTEDRSSDSSSPEFELEAPFAAKWTRLFSIILTI